MRQIGIRPLTGAEKQRRHRERVKARLAEAERLKALLDHGRGDPLHGLAVFCDNILEELGAATEERDLLKVELPAIQGEIRAALEARARSDLEKARATARMGATRGASRSSRKKAS
jgi:hypothetical protein